MKQLERQEQIIEDDYLMDSEDGLRVSEETYWQKYYHHPDFNYEWANGRLEEKTASNLATQRMYGWLVKLLSIFFEVHKTAELIRLRTGFVVPLPPEEEQEQEQDKKKKHIRKPDLGVVLSSNPTPYKSQDIIYHGIPDLCIEAISYTTKKAKERDTKEKKEEYEYAGVKEYYILDDRKTETRFYRLNRWGLYEEIKPIDGDVIKSEVLPGFQFRISDLYRQPDQIELVKDKVYQGFVMLKYQAAKERADRLQQEADRWQQEADRLQAERERLERLRAEKDSWLAEKDRLMALLQQMGITPD